MFRLTSVLLDNINLLVVNSTMLLGAGRFLSCANKRDAAIVGGSMRINDDANTRAYAHKVDPSMLLDGDVRAPHEFGALYKMLTSLSASTHAPGSALSNVETRGSTLLYRMPM